MNRSQTERSGYDALMRFKKVVSQFLNTDIGPMGVLPEDKNVPKSVVNQTPFMIYNGKSPIAKAMKNLTKDYVNSSQGVMKEKASFTRKLKQLWSERQEGKSNG
jgi:flagellar biosynthesis protein FlhG